MHTLKPHGSHARKAQCAELSLAFVSDFVRGSHLSVLKRMQTPGTTPPFFAVSDNCCSVDTNRPKLFSFYLLSFLELFFGDSLCSCLFIYLFSIIHEENNNSNNNNNKTFALLPPSQQISAEH